MKVRQGSSGLLAAAAAASMLCTAASSALRPAAAAATPSQGPVRIELGVNVSNGADWSNLVNENTPWDLIRQNADWVLGGSTALSICRQTATPSCKVLLYVQTQFYQAPQRRITSGAAGNFPYGISCARHPAPGGSPVGSFYGTFMAPNGAYGTDDSVHLHAAGTAGRAGWIVAFNGQNDANIDYFLHRSAPHYVAWLQAALTNCAYGSTPADRFDGIFMDNTTATEADNFKYHEDLNIGRAAGANDRDGDLWNAASDYTVTGNDCSQTPCTGPGEAQSGGSYLSETNDATVEDPDQASWVADNTGLFDSLFHKNGAPFPIVFNGQVERDVSLISACTHCIGANIETPFVKNGAARPAGKVAYTIDICASWNASVPGKKLMLEDEDWNTQPSAAIVQVERRVSYAGLMLCYQPGTTVVRSRLEVAAQPNDLDIWPEYFLVPTMPVETAGAAMPATCGQGTCASGGSHDYCVAGRWPACVFVREFASCDERGSPVGPCAAVLNMTGATQTIAQSWFRGARGAAAYGHLLSFCGPVSGGSYDDPACPAASMGDIGDSVAGAGLNGRPFGTGPGELDFTHFALTAGQTEIAPSDAAILVE